MLNILVYVLDKPLPPHRCVVRTYEIHALISMKLVPAMVFPLVGGTHGES